MKNDISSNKDIEKFFRNQILEIDEETFITPDLNEDDFEGSVRRLSSFIAARKINKFCRELNIDPNNLFLSVSSFVLSKFVYNKNLLFSNSGFFKGNSFEEFPLVLNLNTDLNVRSFFEEIDLVWSRSIIHHDSLLEIANEFDFNPKFLYQFNCQDTPGENYNLILSIIENSNDFELICKFNDSLYSPELIHTFLNSILIVINKLINLSYDDLENTFLKDISIIYRDVPNSDQLEFVEIGDLLIHEIFEKQVELHGERLILTASDGEFTYDELNERANRIANALIKRGVF